MPKGVFIYKTPERDVRLLQGMAAGLDNAQIARSMGLTHGTVRVYVADLYSRLGAKSRSHAVMRAIAEGLIDAPAQAPATKARPGRGRQTTIETRINGHKKRK